MAVPSEGASIIFEALLNTFLNNEYDYIEPKFSAVDVDKMIKQAREK